MTRTALVAGGTGLVGRLLVKFLVESKEYHEVKVLIRKGSKIDGDGISRIEVDYDQLEDVGSALQADFVFCCLGTTIKKAGSKENFKKVDFEYPLKLAKISLKNECQQFSIITAAGANSTSMFFYNQVKGKIEESLRELDLKHLNIFRPSLLLGDRKEPRLGESIGAAVSRIINPIMIGSLRKLRAIHAETVARAMYNVSMRPGRDVNVYESDQIQIMGKR